MIKNNNSIVSLFFGNENEIFGFNQLNDRETLKVVESGKIIKKLMNS